MSEIITARIRKAIRNRTSYLNIGYRSVIEKMCRYVHFIIVFTLSRSYTRTIVSKAKLYARRILFSSLRTKKKVQKIISYFATIDRANVRADEVAYAFHTEGRFAKLITKQIIICS